MLLTENEMVSVNNLTHQQAAQAFLPCDRRYRRRFDVFFWRRSRGDGGGLGPGGGHDHGPDDDMYN